MSYRIEYFREGDLIGAEVAVGTLEATKQAARIGVAERGADLARILDEEGDEVWSIRADP